MVDTTDAHSHVTTALLTQSSSRRVTPKLSEGEHPSEVIFGNLGFSLHCCARMLDETGSLLLLTDSSVLQELSFALVCPIPSTL